MAGWWFRPGIRLFRRGWFKRCNGIALMIGEILKSSMALRIILILCDFPRSLFCFGFLIVLRDL